MGGQGYVLYFYWIFMGKIKVQLFFVGFHYFHRLHSYRRP